MKGIMDEDRQFGICVSGFSGSYGRSNGYTYRILAREMGCPLVYSEMVSDKGINYRNEHTLNMLKTEPEERPMAMQLFGAEADSIAKAAEYVASLNCADILDLIWAVQPPRW